MKIVNVKVMVAKAVLAGTAAAAILFASAPKAQAQGFAVGVQFGHPYYGRRDFEFDRRQALLRHEEWVREHRFYGPRGYGYGYR